MAAFHWWIYAIDVRILKVRLFLKKNDCSNSTLIMFGKYKGRINNYLSAEGYDATQAERDLKAMPEK